MLSRIRFKNYKSFTNWTDLDLRPITIFVGPNSAGKSSILKLIKQLANSSTINDFANIQEPPFGNFKRSLEIKANYTSVDRSPASLYSFAKSKIKSKHNAYNGLHISQPHPLQMSYKEHNFKVAIKAKKRRFSNLFILNELSHFSVSSNNKKLLDLTEKVFEKDDERWFNKAPYETDFVSACNISDFLAVWDNNKIKLLISDSIKNKHIKKYVLELNDHYYSNFNTRMVQIHSLFPPHLDIDSDFIDANINSYVVDLIRGEIPGFKGVGFGEQINFKESLEKIAREIDDDLGLKINDKNSYLAMLAVLFAEQNPNNMDPIHNRITSDSKINQYFQHVLELLKMFEEKYNDLAKHHLNEIFLKVSVFYYLSLFYNFVREQVEVNLNEISKTRYINDLKNESDLIHLAPVRTELLTDFQEYNFMQEDDFSNQLLKGTIAGIQVTKDEAIIKINQIFKVFSLSYELLPPKKNSKSIILRDILSGSDLNIADLGFGFSQIIPIILTCLTTAKNTVLIEQPESQLHPKLQSELAELFYIGAIGRCNQILIETHSEYMIRKFQVLIRQQKLFLDDLAIYYVDKDEKGRSHVREMELDESGQFMQEWPSGFFDESYKHALNLMR